MFALRSFLHQALTSPTGDGFTPLRVTKDILRGVNQMAGEPLCSREELEKRRAAVRRLEELRQNPGKVERKREPAPVTVYFEKDRNHRNLKKITDLLDAKGIKFRTLDVTGDQATLSFVTRESGRERDELPVLFAGDNCIGGLSEVTAADTRGELDTAVFGPS